MTPSPLSFRAVVGRLAAVNVGVTLLTFLTAPLQARALGASGRGDLAAVLVPLTLAGQLLTLAVPAYVAREVPRGRSVSELVGSLSVVMAIVSVGVVACAVPTAAFLADGREPVRGLLIVGFCLIPAGLIGQICGAALPGLERWRQHIAVRLAPPLISLVGVVVLYVLDRLTLYSAAATTFIGGLAATLIACWALRDHGRPSFSRGTARAGLRFGLVTWVGGLLLLINARVDQLAMVKLVSSEELGLYAVAVSIAGLSGFVTGALAPPLINRVAKGDRKAAPRVMRVVFLATIASNIALAATIPLAIPLLFGDQFSGAIPMTWILLLAAVPLAGNTILVPTLQADGAPGVPSRAEVLALILTGLGLATLLSRFGGEGAAATSVVAYSASFVYQLVAFSRRSTIPVREFLIPQRSDVEWARTELLRLRGGAGYS